MKIWKQALTALTVGAAIAVTGCKQEDGSQQNVANNLPEKVEYCDFSAGPEDAAVKVVAYYPGGHEETLGAVKALLEQYPGKVSVQVVDWRHEEGRKLRSEVGLTCAGVAINGKTKAQIEVDGKTDTVVFEKGLSKGQWTADDLKAAVEQELAKAEQ